MPHFYSCVLSPWVVCTYYFHYDCMFSFNPCIKELAQLIPDVNTRLEEIPPYNDAHESQKIIYSTRGKLEHLEPPKYSSAALAGSFSSPSSSTSSLPPYEPLARPMSAGYRGPRRTPRHPDVSLTVLEGNCCINKRIVA